MATANSNIKVADLDFSNIKRNFIQFLQSQDTLKDYNFEGSTMSVLLDVLAYNTHYNSFYLNMVANEMFLDSALQRGSVVSHAKLLNYVPRSSVAPTATVNITFNGVANSSFTLPKFTNFLSEAINGVNYNFVTTDASTVAVSSNTATFTNVQLKQGVPITRRYTVNSTTNPKKKFEITNTLIDTTTLKVLVQENSGNTSYEVYQPVENYLTLDKESKVYFLQELNNGNYEISFGDDILGKELSDGNIITASYIVTDGSKASGANNFLLMDRVPGYTSLSIQPRIKASQGSSKETIDSIKYQAVKSYSAQNRAVSKNDYISAVQQNNLGFSFDAVNVWGGEENDPPVYGQVFISLKPTGGYSLTQVQKQRIADEVIKPISVLTVTPTIVDPDYTYIKLDVNVYYDPTKTSLSASEMQIGIKNAIAAFGRRTLNTFNSTFSSYDLLNTIQTFNNSVITSDYKIKLQKKFYPNLSTPTTYKLYYNVPLQKGLFQSGTSSSPTLQYLDPANPQRTINNVYIDEVPVATFGVESISVINPGYGYQYAPKIDILGDGTGATATAVMASGSIKNVVITNAGNNYTSAIATVTPQPGDTTGQLGALVVNLEGKYGTLRTYYNNNNNAKTILDNNIGNIEYDKGVITLDAFKPVSVNNEFGLLTVTATPIVSTISSSFNRIITIDEYDSNAITVNVIPRTNF
jgi:hypothetical protein